MTRFRMVQSLALTGLVLATIPSAPAVEIEALFLQGDVLPGATSIPGHQATDVVRRNGSARANINVRGDFVGTVHTKTGTFEAANNTIFYHFGSIGGTAPAALRREAMLAGEYQNIFRPDVGIGPNGSTTYAAALNMGTLSGPSSLWQDDTLIYKEGDPIPAGPLSGKFFGGTVGSIFAAPDGEISWSMSYADVANGPELGRALMRGVGAYDTLLKTGDSIGTLGTFGTSFTNPEFSYGGSKFIAGVTLTSGDDVMIINGQPTNFSSGGAMVEGALIPAAAGGQTDDGTPTGTPIEEFRIGTNFAVNEAGDYAASAFTELTNDGDTNIDGDILIYNGEILFREGDIIDGVVLDGQFEGLGLNDRGDLVFGWDDQLFIWNEQMFPSGKLLVDNTTSLTLPDGGVGTVATLSVSQITVTNQVAAGGEGFPVVYFGGRVNPGNLTSLVRLAPADISTGDFNGDGVVDAADYTVWRDSLGSDFLLTADADGSGVIDIADYQIWKANYGTPTPGQITTTPEPSALLLVALASFALALPRR
ncbi:MAG: dockerin type I domain-containing protein [Planctomycetota bacterium]